MDDNDGHCDGGLHKSSLFPAAAACTLVLDLAAFQRVESNVVFAIRNEIIFRDVCLHRCQQTFALLHGDAENAESGNRERKCADTIGTVLVPWTGHFQC